MSTDCLFESTIRQRLHLAVRIRVWVAERNIGSGARECSEAKPEQRASMLRTQCGHGSNPKRDETI